ncbi:small GTP-binding domain protein [Lyngbya aestuarii BL J]|uniref:Small GTP-binding domain protein n=1 Tax=Lyngbya aestuarii BL J TaxID=1348334 RepID=U7QNR3_9CYAN|nr:GTP-binding protein [Lyngbya aestuarii]ERT08892.1 small GTP-binding domain protein [Lyngbya aestuarii BL J]
MTSSDSVESWDFDRARRSLRQAMTRYSNKRRQRQNPPELQATLKTQLDILAASLDKLDQGLIRIAVFGLVSRGKSAVLNALLGEHILQTGPLNGVTQWPRSVRWTVPSRYDDQRDSIPVELIDTPGLDEVGGQVRGEMAQDVTRQADLILFVVSGDLTRTEYEALCELRRSTKPLIVVFNKVDLYTDTEQQAIYYNLQRLTAPDALDFDFDDLNWDSPTPPLTEGEQAKTDSSLLEVVRVAAEPAAVQVRVEWPDGRVTSEWETPPPQIDELKTAIVNILHLEGRSLLALNALVQAREAEQQIAHQTIKLQQSEAEALIWQFTKYKAIAIAINPIAIIDVLATTISDLILIRSLARLYGLPITNYEASQLLRTILLSAGGMILAEWGSGAILGLGKSAAGLATDISTYAGVALTQASISAYGTYTVGRAAQVYLEQGCTWGESGIDTVIQEIINQVDRDTIVYRLRQEFTKP